MTRSRAVSKAIGWNFASLGLQTLVQVAYTAVTSRILAPTDFGAYAATLSLSVLISITFGAGLSASVQTESSMSENGRRDALAWAFRLGVAASGAALLLAYPWALIWQVPGSVATSALAAIGLLLQPLSLVMLALARRLGVHGMATGAQLIASLVASAVGLVAVTAFQARWTVMVMPIAMPWIIVLFVSTRLHLWPLRLATRKRLSTFSRQSTSLALISYWAYWPVPWAVGRFLGPFALGEWSRAQLLAGLPTERVTSASTSVLFPEYRRVPTPQLPSAATDSIIVVGTTVAVGMSILAAASTPVVWILLGDQWPETARLLPLLALAYSLLGFLVPTANYLQQRGHFRGLYLAQGIGGGISWVGAAALMVRPSLVFAGTVFVIGFAITLFLVVHHAARTQVIEGSRLIRSLSIVAALTIPLWCLAALQVIGVADPSTAQGRIVLLSLAIAYGLVAGCVLYLWNIRPLLVRRGVLPGHPGRSR